MGEAAGVADRHLEWIRRLHADRVDAGPDPLGTAGLIDAEARRRAVAALQGGAPVSLSRPLCSQGNERNAGRPGFRLEVFFIDGPIAMGGDHLQLTCHGRDNTHLDGLNHIGLDGTWYGGFASSDPAAFSVAEFARAGIFTRGVHVDVPAVRGTEWVDPDRPVSGADLDAALEAAGVRFEPGDALLLDMGRDRYEAAGHRDDEAATIPGIGEDGARWIVEHGVSVVCWDFLDAVHPDEPPAPVHLLTWAIGLVLVDNCDHSRLRRALGPDRATCALAVAPLPIVGGTGNNVNPLALL
jgi:kynurenine formamidase